MAKYGQTFWGLEWLKALNNIDHGNRLPRGKSYASKGAVASIRINKNKIQAQVKGSRPSPYQVVIEVPEFTDKQKEELTNILAGNAAWLAGLLNRQIPSELLELANKHNIHVFPKQWKDFKMTCSCPDWAVPCKHLAAVFYLLANEIDLNPMLVLNLHCYDAVEALKERKVEIATDLEEPIEDLWTDLDSFKKEPIVVAEEVFDQIDISSIPAVGASFLSLLPTATPFHEKDFKVVLLEHLKFSRNAGAYLLNDKENDWNLQECIDARLLTDVRSGELILKLRYEDGDYELYLIDWVKEALNAEPAYIADWSPTLRLLFEYVKLSLKLLTQTAVMPRMYNVGTVPAVVWEPLMLNEVVCEAMQPFISQTPKELLLVKDGRKVSVLASQQEVALRLCSIFLGCILKEVVPQSSKFDPLDHLQQLFFKQSNDLPPGLKSEQVFSSVNLWLKVLQISQREWTPVIQVEEQYPDFCVSIAVRKRNGAGVYNAVPLHIFKEDKQYQSDRLRVIKDLMLLQEHFPDIGLVVNSTKQHNLMYDSVAFAGVLLNMVPILQLLGMEVILPKALRYLIKPNASLRLSATSKEKAKSWLDLQKLVDFDWQVAVGDESLDVKEFLRLVKGSKGIVQFRDSFIHLTQQDLEKLMKQLQTPPALSKQDALRVMFAREYDGHPVQLTKELQDQLDQLTAMESIAPPDNLRATLRPYQQRGYEWLYRNIRIGFGSILADDMGLGKTLQTISLLLKLKSEGHFDNKKALVVVPTSLLTNWSRELEKFAPDLSFAVYHGAKRKLVKHIDKDVVLSSYGTVRSDADLFNEIKWHVLVIDEAQNIKNNTTAQTKAVKSVKASIKIALSGTPVENRLSEYWSIFDFSNKGFLGSSKFFNDYFARPISFDRDHQKLEAFKRLTEPFVLRRVKTDKQIISDLPDKIENNQYCSLSKEQAAIYENVVENALNQVAESKGIERKGLVFKMMTALKQVCNHPYQYLKEGPKDVQHSGKLQLLLQLLSPILDNGEKTIIFTQYKEMGDLLVELLKSELGVIPLFLHGSLSRQQRDELVHAFQHVRHHRIFILSLKAGGTGLNLTAAQNVIHYDLWWNPAVEAQATDRAYRIGQKNKVMVYRLMSRGTLEEKINDMIHAKKELAGLAVGTGEKWLGELSNHELRDLVRLSATVVQN